MKANNLCPTTFVVGGLAGFRAAHADLAEGLVDQRATTPARDWPPEATAIRVGDVADATGEVGPESEDDQVFIAP